MRYPGQQTFLEVIDSDPTLTPEQKATWRQQCWEDYHARLVAFARKQTFEGAEETMRGLCEGRSAEQLAHWCQQFRLGPDYQ